jgi:protein required for attachment to host cells
MTDLSQGTWVLIADGEKALFLENLTDDADPNLHVWREDRHQNPPAREQGTDRPGRHKDTGLSKQAAPGGLDWSPGQRSGFSETDWHQLEKERFAQELADRLYRYAHQGRFDRLVVVAPPKVLGDLRGKLHKEVADRVVAEIPKTLTNHPVDQIEALVASALHDG